MYDPAQALAMVDLHRWPLLTLCGLAMVANYVWFIEGYRVVARERLYSLPLFCTFFWFAHDLSVVYRYDTWFHHFDHWFPKLWWGALVLTVLFELAFLGQAARLGRPELLPGSTPMQFGLLMAAGAGSAVVVWELLKWVLDDQLYLLMFGVAVGAYPLFSVPLLLRRRSAAGQTPLMWVSYTVLAACYFTATALWLGDGFRDWRWLLFGAGCIAAGPVMTYVVYQMRTNGRTFGMRAPDPAVPMRAALAVEVGG
ncbi:MAG: hypothetical protein QOF38_1755 [Pseudonocardiales bacterium]|nr:hypothetical protein [Pseudonocardiales bacterium]